MTRKLTLLFALAFSLMAHAITEHDVPSNYITSPAKITVAVPDDYNTDTSQTYPVVYLLNGHGGNHKSWSTVINLDSLATVNRMILVLSLIHI